LSNLNFIFHFRQVKSRQVVQVRRQVLPRSEWLNKFHRRTDRQTNKQTEAYRHRKGPAFASGGLAIFNNRHWLLVARTETAGRIVTMYLLIFIYYLFSFTFYLFTYFSFNYLIICLLSFI